MASGYHSSDRKLSGQTVVDIESDFVNPVCANAKRCTGVVVTRSKRKSKTRRIRNLMRSSLWRKTATMIPVPGLYYQDVKPVSKYSGRSVVSKHDRAFRQIFAAFLFLIRTMGNSASETLRLCRFLLSVMTLYLLACGRTFSSKKRNAHHARHRVCSRVHRRSEKGKLNKKVQLYRKMPLKAVSRLWGKFNSLDLPNWLRTPAYSLYIWMFNCNLEEAAIEDLSHYRNLGEFFRRQLKPYVRTIDSTHSITSPADGRVLHFGRVQDGRLEQVKGVTYCLQGFLGPHTWTNNTAIYNENHNIESAENTQMLIDEKVYESSLKMQKEGTDLFHCIIYLAPGDYHRFHSPTDWTVEYRRHFLGDLLSVNPGVAKWVQGLFNLNERAVYYGTWTHGFFSMAAVGATNVGSIKCYFDDDLVTNTGEPLRENHHYDKAFWADSRKGIDFTKGEMFGEFNLGSTIVLVFEAPKSFDFKIKNGQKIKFGEPVGCHNNNA